MHESGCAGDARCDNKSRLAKSACSAKRARAQVVSKAEPELKGPEHAQCHAHSTRQSSAGPGLLDLIPLAGSVQLVSIVSTVRARGSNAVSIASACEYRRV